MRVLIATVTAGAGHLQAALALEEAWRSFRPRDTLRRVDVLDYTPKLYRKIYSEGYVKLVSHAPELYRLAFRKSDDPGLMRKLTRLRKVLGPLPARRFIRFLGDYRPDAVLCPHFLPLEILGSLDRDPAARKPYLVGIVTDFEAHALWMERSVDLYCVAAEETKARLVARGVPAGRVVVTGIPVSVRFGRRVDPAQARKGIGLRDDLPVLLVLSGGFGVGPIGRILAEIDRLGRRVQVVVVCGRNEELRREIAAQDRRHPTHVFGFVANMHELMAAADLILTKPGGLTSSEALAMGKPLVLLDPIPGQEEENADFLLEHGAAVKVSRVEDLPFRLERLVGSPKLAAISRAAASLGRPDAGMRICREVQIRCSS